VVVDKRDGVDRPLLNNGVVPDLRRVKQNEEVDQRKYRREAKQAGSRAHLPHVVRVSLLASLLEVVVEGSVEERETCSEVVDVPVKGKQFQCNKRSYKSQMTGIQTEARRKANTLGQRLEIVLPELSDAEELVVPDFLSDVLHELTNELGVDVLSGWKEG
jgi:hypothetical protein